MKQISNAVFCEDFVLELELSSRLMPNQYYEYPYLLIKGFLPEYSCNMISEHTFNTSEEEAEEAKVKTTILNSIVDPRVDESIRKTVIHKLPQALLEEYDKSFKKHQKEIEDFFSIALTTSTKVQVLEYTQGAFYIKHADDSNELVNDKAETVGFIQVAAQRKISTVLFATSCTQNKGDAKHFKGGELVFNYLSDVNGETIKFCAKAGDMLVFPSNPIYSHEVLPVEEGYRLTLVQWHNGIIA